MHRIYQHLPQESKLTKFEIMGQDLSYIGTHTVKLEILGHFEILSKGD